MSLLWIEGFEARMHSDYQLRLYDERIGGIVTGVSGRKHGLAITATGGNFRPPEPMVPSVQNTWIGQIAIRKDDDADLTGDGAQIVFRDSGGEQCSVVQVDSGEGNASFKMEIRRGATVLATSISYHWSANSRGWHVFQFKALIDPTVGTYELKHWDYLNSLTTPLSGSGANTANQGTAGADRCTFGFGSAGRTQRMDDVVIMDGSGSVNNNSTALPIVVHGGDTQSDGTVQDWLPSLGGGHAVEIDDAAFSPLGTDKVTSATVSDIDMFNLAAFGLIAPTSTPTILGVMPYVEGNMENSGTRTLRARVRNVVTEANGADDMVFNTTSKVAYHEIMETNPVTAVAWTLANLDADEFGFQLTV